VEAYYSTSRKVQDLSKELEVAVTAVKRAGEVLRNGFGQRQEVKYKGEVDIVTKADEDAERAIKEVLQETFPDYGMLAEEGGRLEGEGDSRWIVDPLDGTTNYAHGLPFFSISIALERNSEVVLGVVHDPTADETYTAERGSGAFLNGEPIGVSDTDELIRALLATGFLYDRDEVPQALDIFGQFAMSTQSIRRLGSAALDLCYVAVGRLDGYYERGIKAWDIAAGVLILREAGGKATDYLGHELELGIGEVVASNGLLHPDLIRVTREYHC
jgi:myo-inositol-1(or 4)-monophosphatase